MSKKVVLSQRLLEEQVAACSHLRPLGMRVAMRRFSEKIQENISEDSWAGVFKFMVLQAFQLKFSPEMVAAVCRGLSQLSGMDTDDVGNLAKEIASGKFGSNEVDRILSEHYKIDDSFFPETDRKVLAGNVKFDLDLSTGLITGPTPVKPKNDGPEAFQVGMS